jgi:hypothetical protein
MQWPEHRKDENLNWRTIYILVIVFLGATITALYCFTQYYK